MKKFVTRVPNRGEVERSLQADRVSHDCTSLSHTNQHSLMQYVSCHFYSQVTMLDRIESQVKTSMYINKHAPPTLNNKSVISKIFP